jgi:DNA adenine methylase
VNRDAKESMAAHATRDSDCATAYRFEKTNPDHVDLAAFLNAPTGYVIVSSYRSDLYDDIFAGWHRVDRMGDDPAVQAPAL